MGASNRFHSVCLFRRNFRHVNDKLRLFTRRPLSLTTITRNNRDKIGERANRRQRTRLFNDIVRYHTITGRKSLLTTVKAARVTRILRGTRRQCLRRVNRTANLTCRRLRRTLKNNSRRITVRKSKLMRHRQSIPYTKKRISRRRVRLTPRRINPRLNSNANRRQTAPRRQLIVVLRRRISKRSLSIRINLFQRSARLATPYLTNSTRNLKSKKANGIHIRRARLVTPTHRRYNRRDNSKKFARTAFATTRHRRLFSNTMLVRLDTRIPLVTFLATETTIIVAFTRVGALLREWLWANFIMRHATATSGLQSDTDNWRRNIPSIIRQRARQRYRQTRIRTGRHTTGIRTNFNLSNFRHRQLLRSTPRDNNRKTAYLKLKRCVRQGRTTNLNHITL